MSNRSCKVDVTQPLTPNFGMNDFDATLVADDSTVLHALVLAADTLKITHWPEDLGAKQTIAFRLERPVVDGFWLFNFAVRPAADFLWRCQRNLDGREIQRIRRLIKKIQ